MRLLLYYLRPALEPRGPPNVSRSMFRPEGPRPTQPTRRGRRVPRPGSSAPRAFLSVVQVASDEVAERATKLTVAPRKERRSRKRRRNVVEQLTNLFTFLSSGASSSTPPPVPRENASTSSAARAELALTPREVLGRSGWQQRYYISGEARHHRYRHPCVPPSN